MKKPGTLSALIYAGAAILALAPNLYVVSSGGHSAGVAAPDNFFPATIPSAEEPGIPAISADGVFPLLREKGLPVGEVTLHAAENERGVAVLIPQNHRYPGSSVSDPRNDSAEVAQKQIYEITDYLRERYGLGLVLVEGELEGPVPAGKIDALAERISLRERFGRQTETIERELESASPGPGFAENFTAGTGEFLASLDREIILAGAPYKLRAEGEDIRMFGAEYENTRNECVKIVGDYIHQTERLAQLETPGSRPPSGGAPTRSGRTGLTAEKIMETAQKRIEELKRRILAESRGALTLPGLPGAGSAPSLLSMADLPITGNITLPGLSRLISSLRDPLTVLRKNLEVLESWSRQKNNQGLLNSVKEAKKTLAMMDKNATARTSHSSAAGDNYDHAVLAVSSAVLPATNPYSAVNDPKQLEDMLNETGALIEEKVIKQRDKDAAQIFADTLAAADEKTGIIQFGAGHETGLVEELNAKNITVVVIKPDEVLRREKADAEVPRIGI